MQVFSDLFFLFFVRCCGNTLLFGYNKTFIPTISWLFLLFKSKQYQVSLWVYFIKNGAPVFDARMFFCFLSVKTLTFLYFMIKNMQNQSTLCTHLQSSS